MTCTWSIHAFSDEGIDQLYIGAPINNTSAASNSATSSP